MFPICQPGSVKEHLRRARTCLVRTECSEFVGVRRVGELSAVLAGYRDAVEEDGVGAVGWADRAVERDTGASEGEVRDGAGGRSSAEVEGRGSVIGTGRR